MPTLSVVIPCHDEEQVIGDCLDRLVDQIDHIHEIVVVDNNSTDGTAEILESCADPRLRVLQAGGRGVSAARNAALAVAQGELVAYLDSDNVWSPQFLEVMTDELRPDVDADSPAGEPRPASAADDPVSDGDDGVEVRA